MGNSVAILHSFLSSFLKKGSINSFLSGAAYFEGGPLTIFSLHLRSLLISVAFPCICLYFHIMFFKKIYLFMVHWVFVAACGLSLVAANGVYSSLRCAGFSLRCLLLLRSTGSRRVVSVVVVLGLSCSAACGIFPDKGSNSCPLHWQANS